MGVLGFTPFIQKNFPEVIKKLPNRLREISGKRIVIDGTLITQRLHFAQAPYPSRHVLGWYRIIQELNECGVSAVCVFDGKERNLAKAREVERRRDARRLATFRGSLENQRLKRLESLRAVLHRSTDLESEPRRRIPKLLQQVTLGTETVSEELSKRLEGSIPSRSTLIEVLQPDPPAVDSDLSLPDNSSELGWDLARPNGPIDVVSMPKQGQSQLDVERASSEISDNDFPLTKENEPGSSKEIQSLEIPGHDSAFAQNADSPVTSPADRNVDPKNVRLVYDPSGPLVSPNSPPQVVTLLPQDPANEFDMKDEDIPTILAALYLDYRHSVSELTSIQTAPPLPSSSVSTASTDVDDTRLEQVMSKAQLQLAMEEGKLWDGITRSSCESMLGQLTTAGPVKSLEGLAQKSQLMSESYERRTNPPTTQTYDESKEILTAMGVPCIESAGAYEAEALACSIVLNGHADYVASEDTDVLIYEAPLIRNISNRQDPLLVISGADIRTVLDLNRDSYIDFALLLGTDFSQRIRQVGPSRAYKFIKEYGSIERVIESETKYTPQISTDAYLAQVELARTVFRTLPPVPEKELLQSGERNNLEVARILERHRLGRFSMENEYWDYQKALVGNYFGDDPSIL